MFWTAILLAAAPPASPAPPPHAPAAPAVGQGAVTTASGLRIETLAAGTGAAPRPGGAVLVSYEGRLADGTLFEATSAPAGLAVSELVPGFTEALLMMRAGGRYRFWIPAHLAYGERGVEGTIPADAELEFTLTLHHVGRPARTPVVEPRAD
ncbi:MAG TPA: FKBP-type peptidyl-prolyl cis-trans isomerase [Allosphingosinicella sp.]|nr:FKBP-type peptidyl-prolyl cis-trans isomerase [Allosphingosinicella sp.]